MTAIQGSPTQAFLRFTDQDGNTLVSLNKDGSVTSTGIITPAIQFSDGSVLVSAEPAINEQAGTTYLVSASDFSKLVTFNNASSVAVTLPAPSSGGTSPAGFTNGWHCYVQNTNSASAGLVTLTPAAGTINGWPQIVLGGNQSALIYTDGVNYFALFTQIASTDAASSLSAYLTNDAGTAAAQNQIVMINRTNPNSNLKRKGLNIYLETNAGQAGAIYDGLQVNVGCTVDANTTNSPVEAAEFFVLASGSDATVGQITAVKARNSVLSNTTVVNVIAFLAYLPQIFGTVTNYVGIEFDAPTGGGTVNSYIGVHCDLNLADITVTGSAFGAVLGGGGGSGSAALFLNNTNTNSGAIVWGPGGAGPGAIANGIYSGAGSPNGVVTANPGSMYLNTSGGSGTTLYVKESGTGTNTGWVGK